MFKTNDETQGSTNSPWKFAGEFGKVIPGQLRIVFEGKVALTAFRFSEPLDDTGREVKASVVMVTVLLVLLTGGP